MSTATIAASPYPTAVNGQCVKQSPSENCVFSSFWVSSRKLKAGHCEACAMHFKVCVPECIEERLVRQMALCVTLTLRSVADHAQAGVLLVSG